MPKDRESGAAGHPLHMAGSTGTSGLCDYQPFPQPCEGGDKQRLHSDSAAVGRMRPHYAGYEVYRRGKDRSKANKYIFVWRKTAEFTSETLTLAWNCKGCPLRCLCYKARGDRLAIEVNHRLNGYKEKARELLASEEDFRYCGR